MSNIYSKVYTEFYPQYNFRFSGLKDTYDKYVLLRDADGKLIVKDKETKVVTSDKLMVARMRFCISWFDSVGLALGLGGPQDSTEENDKLKYHFVFRNDKIKASYTQMMTIICKQLKTTGNIDMKEISRILDKEYGNEYGYNIVNELSSNQRYLDAINDWSRYAIPDALQQTKPLLVSCEQENHPRM